MSNSVKFLLHTPTFTACNLSFIVPPYAKLAMVCKVKDFYTLVKYVYSIVSIKHTVLLSVLLQNISSEFYMLSTVR